MSVSFSLEVLKQVEEILNYEFKNKSYLVSAMTHHSYVQQDKPKDEKFSNERLAFLGDSVLSLIVVDRAFEKLAKTKEGGLRRLRSKLIKESTCAEYFTHLTLSKFLRLSCSEKKHLESIGNDKIASHTIKAVLAAIFKDGGLDAAITFFNARCLPAAKPLLKDKEHLNWRRKLQELCYKKMKKQPSYVLLGEEGPQHSKVYKIGVFMDDDLLGKGTGKSKKIAATLAASKALEKIKD